MNLSGAIWTQGPTACRKGLTNAILEAVNHLLDTAVHPVSTLAGDIEHMAHEHDRGDIDAVLSTSSLHGPLPPWHRTSTRWSQTTSR
jgi:methyl-accepting chemotaxis protein